MLRTISRPSNRRQKRVTNLVFVISSVLTISCIVFAFRHTSDSLTYLSIGLSVFFGIPSVYFGWLSTRGIPDTREIEPLSQEPPPDMKAWNVPIRRNLMFTGREDVLAVLETELNSGNPVTLTQAIHGLGGIGKTQTAAEYAWRHATDFDVVWWVQSEKPELLAGDFGTLAEKLGLADAQMLKADVVREYVCEWLRTHDRWLIIFDNAEKPEDIREWLPQGQGQVIITSRHSTWGTTARAVNLSVWPEGEAIDFLGKRTGCKDRDGAAELAQELGYLPLAVEQAAAYTEHTKTDFAGYLKLYRTQHTALLGKSLSQPSTQYPDTVLTTWTMSFTKVNELCPAAVDLLNLMAFLAPDDLPRDLLIAGAEFLPEDLAKMVQDDNLFSEAVAALSDYSLVKRNGEALSVHRMVQAVMRDRLNDAERQRWAAAAVQVVNRAFPNEASDVRNWPECKRLMDHALAAVEHGEHLKVAAEATAYLLNQLGTYTWGRAVYAQAEGLFRRALPIYESALGVEHPHVATLVNNLGLVLKALGDWAGAKKCIERALEIDETAYGPNHPNVAIRVNNLGLVLQDLGDLKGAKECYERALKIGETVYGPDHPKVAIRVNNLGSVLQELGDLAGAKKCVERALSILEDALGADHPNVATSVNNLGGVLQDLGDLKGAKECYERALRIDEAAYGPAHPKVATDVNNLGGVLQALGDLKGAKKCVERAYCIFLKTLGPEHPHTKQAKENFDSLG